MDMLCLLPLFATILSFAEGELVDSLYLGDYEFSYYVGGDNTLSKYSGIRYKCTSIIPGSTMIMIKTKRIQEAVEEILRRRKLVDKGTWVGGNDGEKSLDFYWVDGTLIKTHFTNWAKGSPPLSRPSYHKGKHYIYVDLEGSEWKWFVTARWKQHGYICQTKVDTLIPSYFAELEFGSINITMTYWDATKECEKNQSKIIDVASKDLFHMLKEKCASDPTLKYWIKKEEDSSDCLVMGSLGWSRNDCDDPTVHFVCEQTRPWNLKIDDEFPTAVKHESFNLNCAASGNPIPIVSWFREGEEIAESSDKRIHQVKTDGRSRLIIQETKMFDGGIYHCYANSSKHHARGYTNLKVAQSTDDPGHTEQAPENHYFDSLKKTYMNKRSEYENGDSKKSSDNTSEQQICESWKLIVFIVMAILWIIVLISFVIYICCSKPTKSDETFTFRTLEESSNVNVDINGK